MFTRDLVSKYFTFTILADQKDFCVLIVINPNVPQTFLIYSVILSVLDPRKCEYLKDYSLDFEHAYMTTYLAS